MTGCRRLEGRLGSHWSRLSTSPSSRVPAALGLAAHSGRLGITLPGGGFEGIRHLYARATGRRGFFICPIGRLVVCRRRLNVRFGTYVPCTW